MGGGCERTPCTPSGYGPGNDVEVTYQTRGVFHQDIQTPRSGLKKRGAADFFLTDFEVFGSLMKHFFEFSI